MRFSRTSCIQSRIKVCKVSCAPEFFRYKDRKYQALAREKKRGSAYPEAKAPDVTAAYGSASGMRKKSANSGKCDIDLQALEATIIRYEYHQDGMRKAEGVTSCKRQSS